MRNRLGLLVAPVLGLTAMILPVLLRRPARWYDAPLFPVIRNAQEHLGIWQLVFFVGVGIVLGLAFPNRAAALGGAAIVALPLAAIAEMVVDPTSHNLWPFEFLFDAFYGALVAVGVVVARRLARRAVGPTKGA
jgi:hypothetical protein